MPYLAPISASVVEQEQVLAVRAFDGNAELLPQLGRSAGMVDVAMGEQDLLDRDAALADGIEDRGHVAAGIDDGAHLSRLVEDQRAVLLEGRHGNDEGLELCHGRGA